MFSFVLQNLKAACISGTNKSVFMGFLVKNSIKIKIKTNFVKKTFYYRAAILWNKLPPNIRANFNSLSVNQFENVIAL